MSTSQTTHVKTRSGAPDGFFAAEAAGLAWLAETMVDGGVAVVEVVAQDESSLTLARLETGAPRRGQREAAQAFGAALAATHAAGADAFGALAPGAAHYFFGPLHQPLRLPSKPRECFGEFYVQSRLRPVLDGMHLPARAGDLALRVCAALEDGAADTWPNGRDVEPARVHGDLWSGNVMWTREGAVVIDPAACGHHPLADLAMLTLFGAPHLEAVLESYAAAANLPDGWRDQLPLHQLFGWLVHLRLFGGSYASAVDDALERSAHLLGV